MSTKDAEALEYLQVENEALKANIAAIFDAAVECHENPHSLTPYPDYLRYRITMTTGHAYAVQTVVDALEQNRRYEYALIEIGEWDSTRTLGYEGPRDIARKALKPEAPS